MEEYESNPMPGLNHAKTFVVTVPASVAFDFKKMVKVQEIILSKLGCPGCHSGFDIRFQLDHQFRFNENLELIESFGR